MMSIHGPSRRSNAPTSNTSREKNNKEIIIEKEAAISGACACTHVHTQNFHSNYNHLHFYQNFQGAIFEGKKTKIKGNTSSRSIQYLINKTILNILKHDITITDLFPHNHQQSFLHLIIIINNNNSNCFNFITR